MKSEVYKEKVNTREEQVARIMNSAAIIKQERQDIRRVPRAIAKRDVENWTHVYTNLFTRNSPYYLTYLLHGAESFLRN